MINKILGDREERKELGVSEELYNRLKHKGMHDDRIMSLDKFNHMTSSSIKHGINIKTDLESIEYGTHDFNEGKTSIKLNKTRIENITATYLTFDEFMHTSHTNYFDNEYKDKIIKFLTLKFSEPSSNKLDYLHRAMSNTNLMIFKKQIRDKNITDDVVENVTVLNNSNTFFEIERTIDGNSYNHLIIIVEDDVDLKFGEETFEENYGSTTEET